MSCCLWSAIKSGATSVPIRRPLSSDYRHGRWREQQYQAFTIRAWVQPVTGNELVRVPEGSRNKGVIKLYTDELLKTASVEDQTEPDLLDWHDRHYQVYSVEDWLDDGGYYKVLAIEVGQ